MNVPEMGAKLAELNREVMRGEEQYKNAQKLVAETAAALEEAGIDPNGNLDAQLKDYEIKAERAATKAFAALKALQEKVNAEPAA